MLKLCCFQLWCSSGTRSTPSPHGANVENEQRFGKLGAKLQRTVNISFSIKFNESKFRTSCCLHWWTTKLVSQFWMTRDAAYCREIEAGYGRPQKVTLSVGRQQSGHRRAGFHLQNRVLTTQTSICFHTASFQAPSTDSCVSPSGRGRFQQCPCPVYFIGQFLQALFHSKRADLAPSICKRVKLQNPTPIP